MQPLLLSINDAAYMIACSRPTLYKLIRENRIQAVKNGGRTLITMKTLCDFVESLPKFGQIKDSI